MPGLRLWYAVLVERNAVLVRLNAVLVKPNAVLVKPNELLVAPNELLVAPNAVLVGLNAVLVELNELPAPQGGGSFRLSVPNTASRYLTQKAGATPAATVALYTEPEAPGMVVAPNSLALPL
ncbi:hypothetical protein AGMMS49942_27440 [Spirochaetia bacterium]|nr:hypothetical protein AGMMS49942_27440 [Spirochaetia bacterium]